MQEYKKILVAIDGSNGADAALTTAVEVASRNHAHLDVLRVLDLSSLEYGGAGIALDGGRVYELEQKIEKYLLNLKDKLINERGLDANQVDVHVRFGNAKVVITHDFQPEYQNDLIVVGATGKNFLQRMVIGSVASYVVRTARCDVLMAKPSHQAQK